MYNYVKFSLRAMYMQSIYHCSSDELVNTWIYKPLDTNPGIC